MRTPWSQKDDTTLTDLWTAGGVHVSAIAERLGRSIDSVRQRATTLGITRASRVTNLPEGVWTEARIEMLKELSPTGLSAAQVAKAINTKLGGAFSRSAIIGKRNRLGLSMPRPVSAPKRAAKTEPRKTVAQAPKPIAGPPVRARPLRPERPQGPGLATVMSVGAGMCRWPIGDPRDPAFTFCGHRVERGSYCAGHTAIAYVAPTGKAKAQPQIKRRFA